MNTNKFPDYLKELVKDHRVFLSDRPLRVCADSNLHIAINVGTKGVEPVESFVVYSQGS